MNNDMKFNIYGSYGCDLKSGKSIILKREISANEENLQTELEEALNDSSKNKTLIELQNKELIIFENLKEKLNEWQEIAEKISIIKISEEYEQCCDKLEKLETTNNKWVNTQNCRNNDFLISNKTYRMTIRVYEDTKYKDGKEMPYKWEVSYWLSTNNQNGRSKIIASINRKVFNDKEEVYKYVEGRKKYFSKYFKELYQPIKEGDELYFKVYGKLLRNYVVEK